MSKLVHISLSPNLETDDLILSLKSLFSPWNWKKSLSQSKLTQKINSLYPQSTDTFLTNSARSALILGLKSLNLSPKSEIILQPFTCSATINPLINAGVKPVYVDLNLKTFNLDPQHLHSSLTKNTKAILIQHTFGTPADIKKIKSFCQKNNLLLIEDCAHALGAKYNQKLVGSFGDISIISFGRDKVISSIFGGALIINNPKFLPASKKYFSSLPYPPISWTIQQLLHPLISQFSKTTYNLNIGKAILYFSQKLKLISKAVYPSEKLHQIPSIFPAKLPEALASLALHQIQKLNQFNHHRQQIAQIYKQKISHPAISQPKWNKNSIYLRYNITLDSPKKLFKYLQKHHIITGDWYRQPITPSQDIAKTNYQKGSCPQAEYLCQHSLNLPTHPLLSLQQAEKIINIINTWPQK